jgi:hypothetical protein
MGKVTTKSSPVAPRQTVQDEIRELAEHLPSRRRSALLKTSKTLADLPASQRRRALGIIRQRAGGKRFDYRWITSFLVVLGRLKAEEDHPVRG